MGCHSLHLKPQPNKDKSRFSKRSYNFDIFKVDQIFDIVLKYQQTVLSEGHKIPSLEQIKGRKYCKFHGDCGHSTNNCVRFMDVIRKGVEEGRLVFNGKEKGLMKIETDPFPPTVSTNYVEPICINMVEATMIDVYDPTNVAFE